MILLFWLTQYQLNKIIQFNEFIEQIQTPEGSELQSKLSQFHQKESTSHVNLPPLSHEQLQGLSGTKGFKNNEKSSSPSFNLRDNHLQQTCIGQLNDSARTFHNSLSKFQFDSHLNQVSKIYGMGINHKRQKITPPTYQPGNQQQTIALVQMRTRHAKHEAAREIILSSHKNKSIQAKRSDVRESLDRYKPNLEVTAYAETSSIFPSIEKKTITNFASQTMKDETSLETFQQQIRDRMKDLLHKSLQKNQKKQIQKKKGKQQITVSNKFRMRQELYGLLPIFRTPVISLDGYKTKNHSYQRKSNKKIINQTPIPTAKDTIEHYLEHNVASKMLLVQKSKEIISYSYKQIPETPIQAQIIQKKDEINTQQTNHAKSKQAEIIQKQVVDVKNKTKKQATSLTDVKYQGQLTVYELKIRSYREFLFMVNLAHRIFDPIQLKDANVFKPEHRYKFYLGKGNNYLLVKSLLKRRFWWTVEQDPKKANFVWTQLKINYFYQFQRKSYAQNRHYKLDQDFEQFEQNQKKKKTKVQQQQAPPKAGVFKAPLPPSDKKIFTNSDKHYYDDFLEKVQNPEKMLKFSNRLKHFQQKFMRPRACQNIKDERMHNHLQYNYFIGNKKALFYNLKQYYDIQKKNVFDIIPLTYHIKNGTADPYYEIFTKQFKRLAKEKGTNKNASKNIWIVKPGQLSNRGQGITVIDEIYELNNILKKKEKHSNGSEKTYIVQKYIEKPLLYKNRKFDIRHYMMISRLHGVMRAYWFGQGYIRTSSYQFNIGQISESIIHLTNDAIQKYCEGYGKYEEGNKVSYNEFQRYMDSTYGQGKFSFSQMIYPKMKAIALDAVKATYLQLDPNNAEHNFQVFGLDFMIDANYNVWLIEVNTNPCLQLSSKLLARLIPTMVEHSLRLTLDVIYPPPSHYPNSQKYLAPDNPLERLQFQLIFDENRDGKQVQQLFAGVRKVDMGQVDEQDETYQNDGKQIQLNSDQIQ